MAELIQRVLMLGFVVVDERSFHKAFES